MVKPTVKSGFVGDVTFTFIIRMKGKTRDAALEVQVWRPMEVSGSRVWLPALGLKQGDRQ